MDQGKQPFGRRFSETLALRPDGTVRSKPGRALWPLLALAMPAAYLVQLVPLLNLILVFALSPLWIGVLFNAMLIAMALDVRRGAALRMLLAVPIAVYGLNLAASGGSYLYYRVLDQRLTRENAAQSLPFDPARMSLVAPQEIAEGLVQRYAVPVTYADKPYGDSERPSSFRVLTKATCDTIPESPDLAMRSSGPRIDRDFVQGACLLQLPAEPSLPPLSVSREGDPYANGPGRRVRLLMTGPDGRRAVLTRQHVGILSPIPFPLVGCVTWTNGLECTSMMAFLPLLAGDGSSGAQDAEAQRIASVLGLKPRASQRVPTRYGRTVLRLDDAETERLTADAGPALDEARAYAGKAVEARLAWFSRLIAGEEAAGQGGDTWIVVQHADRLDGQAEALMAAIERDIGDRRHADRLRTMGRVAAVLTPPAFARIGPRLLAAVAREEELQQADGLVTRLGDLGAPAGPTLVGLFDVVNGTRRVNALLGLCRAGQQALAYAGPAAAAARADSRPDAVKAGVVALQRMGRGDLAAQLAQTPIDGGLNEVGKQRHRRWLDEARSKIGPETPRAACNIGHDDRLADVAWLRE